MMYKCTTNAVLVGKHCVISHVCPINFWNQNKTHHYNFKIAPRSCFEMCSMVLGCIFLIRALLHKYARQEALSILTNQEKSQCVCVCETQIHCSTASTCDIHTKQQANIQTMNDRNMFGASCLCFSAAWLNIITKYVLRLFYPGVSSITSDKQHVPSLITNDDLKKKV